MSLAHSAFQNSAIAVVHGIARHDRNQIQETFTCGLIEHLNRAEPNQSGRWVSEIDPISDWKSEVRSVEFRSWDGVQDRTKPITQIFESFWSPITRQAGSPLNLRAELKWAWSMLIRVSSIRSRGSKVKMLSDSLCIALIMLVSLLAFVATLTITATNLFIFLFLLSQPLAAVAVVLSTIIVSIVMISTLQLSVAIASRTVRPRSATAPDVVAARVKTNERLNWIFRPAYSIPGQRFYLGVRNLLALLWQIFFSLSVFGLGSRVQPANESVVVQIVSMEWLVALASISIYFYVTDRARDLRVYLTTDENGENFICKRRMVESQKRDLSRIVARLRRAGRSESLILVGHSLGGKLITDVLIELGDEYVSSENRRVRERAKNILMALKAVVLTGSPLSLIEHMSSVEGNTASELRRRGVLRTVLDGTWDVRSERVPLTLINAWCAADPISGPISAKAFKSHNVRIKRLPWLLAHTAYFTSPQYWTEIISILSKIQIANYPPD